jgi:hypothetical protein
VFVDTGGGTDAGAAGTGPAAGAAEPVAAGALGVPATWNRSKLTTLCRTPSS